MFMTLFICPVKFETFDFAFPVANNSSANSYTYKKEPLKFGFDLLNTAAIMNVSRSISF